MSAPGLTSEAQLRYLLQWFGEFSELQREDFLPILAAARADKPDLLAACLAQLSCDEKPVSLFQCRIKLFNEWFATWSDEEQERLVKGVTEMDAEFGTKLQETIINGPKVNGDYNGADTFAPAENGVEVSESENNLNGQETDSVPEEAVEEPEEESIPEPLVIQDGPVEIAAAS